ncbi:cupin domain-containing protein [Desulfosporosinus fructosivorans]|uniref:Cupin domain-containing protein n=1 Tax=Desulfosporosinus fructosivorans TaxID=2018669 RepID=A0A4Z0RAU1_9FIRM|nr:cupin domain-containing protein [Desulfosporosinus fructosivorans]TGE39277.1 cupin domain-containing protein [Desulfosporosinus fructosivorans]
MVNDKVREIISKDHVHGGNGSVLLENLMAPELLGEHCKLFAKVRLKPGCEIGYHEHHGESEAYYLLSGAGIYQDNKNMIPVKAGDITYCEAGTGHGIKNTGTNDLELIALILSK